MVGVTDLTAPRCLGPRCEPTTFFSQRTPQPQSIEDMARRDATGWFLEFRRTGSGRAFRRFFDLTAGDLAPLAVGLCPHGVDPQDLLQATYVRAIELRDRYDGARTVGPWLTGLLANVAHEERRRARRQRSVDGDDLHAALPTEVEDDPSAVAATREAAGVATDAIERLDAPYRTVVDLYARCGLTPGEIARALGQPPGTVRSQLHRGLQRLRAGLCGAAAPTLLFGGLGRRALAEVRQQVATHHGIATASVASSLLPSIGGLLMKTGWVTFTLCSATVLAFLGWTWKTPAPPREDDPSPQASIEPTVGPGASSPRATRDSPARMDAPAAPIEWEEMSSMGTASTLVVRVVRADDSPFAGVGVWVEHPSRRDRWSRFLEPVVVRTDAAGKARFPVIEPGAWIVRCDRDAATSATVPRDGEAHVELRVPIGVDLIGTVIDAEGRGVPGATVSAVGAGLGRPLATSDVDGRFVIEEMPCRAFVVASAAGHAPSRRVRIDASPGSEVRATLELGPAATLSGVVRLADGRPCEDAVVAICPTLIATVGQTREGLSEYSRRPVVVHTDEHGAFTCDDAYVGTVTIAAAAPSATDLAPVVVKETLTAHRPHRVELRLPAPAAIHGRVVDSAGMPVAGETIHAMPAEPFVGLGYSPFTHGSTTTAADGTYRIDALRPAATTVFIADGRGDPAAKETIELDEGLETRVELVFEAPVSLEVSVVDGTGAALEGWLVRAGPRRHVNGLFARTDARGMATFERLPRQWLEVVACSPDQVADEVRFPSATRHVRPDGQRIVLTVGPLDKPGALRVTVLDEAAHPVASCPYTLGTESVGFTRSGVSDRAGTIAVDGLPPGEYVLTVRPRDHAGVGVSATITAGATRTLDPIRLTRGGVVELTMQVPASVEQDAMSVTVRDPAGMRRGFVPQSDDTWTSPLLDPGWWTLCVHGPGVAPATTPVQVHAGGKSSARITLEPAADRRLELTAERAEEWVRGRIRLRPAATSEWIADIPVAGELGGRNPLRIPMGLPPGRYDVEVDLETAGRWMMITDVEDDAVRLHLD